MSANTLQNAIEHCIGQYDTISANRKAVLHHLIDYIQQQVHEGRPVLLNFICTHNSRRSHLSHIWAQTAADFYEIPVQTFSGGTEATAFNPRAVASLIRLGFDIKKTDATDNPVYEVTFPKTGRRLPFYSKIYHEAPNPEEGYCAVMTCSEADEGCPVVRGAAARVAVPYIDPKAADDTPQEAATYDERARQIGGEMFYVFSLIKT